MTSTTPSTSHISRIARGMRSSCGPVLESPLPVSVTMPSWTVTLACPGPGARTSSSTLRVSAAMSSSGRRNTLSRSRRLTMPMSIPCSLTTGSLRTWCVLISRAAAGTVASGPIVMAGVDISSPAVSTGCRSPRVQSGRWAWWA
jgi:hypothetical protein